MVKSRSKSITTTSLFLKSNVSVTEKIEYVVMCVLESLVARKAASDQLRDEKALLDSGLPHVPNRKLTNTPKSKVLHSKSKSTSKKNGPVSTFVLPPEIAYVIPNATTLVGRSNTQASTTVSLGRAYSRHRFAVLTKILGIIHSLHASNGVLNKRDIYYLDTNFFKSQQVTDTNIAAIARWFSCTRHELSILSSTSSNVYGEVVFDLYTPTAARVRGHDGRLLNCKTEKSTISAVKKPTGIPTCASQTTLLEMDEKNRDSVCTPSHTAPFPDFALFAPERSAQVARGNAVQYYEVQSQDHKSPQKRAKFILFVEKEAVFSQLIQDNAQKTLGRHIMVGSRGMVDHATTAFLRECSRVLKIPLVILCDGDPHGAHIALVVAKGHVNQRAYHAPVHWIGIHPSDGTMFQVSGSDRQMLTSSDKAMARSMLTRCVDLRDGALAHWRRHVEQMLERNEKMDILSVLLKNDSDCKGRGLTTVYLSEKLRHILLESR